MFVCCECCVLLGRGLCDGLITRPEESYRLWCVFVCDLETSRRRRPWPALGRNGKKNVLKAVDWKLSPFLKFELTKAQSSWFQTFALLWMFCSLSWVIPQSLNFICRRFGTLCLFHLHRSTYEDGTECSETWHIKFRCRGISQKKEYNKS